jgi:hypothetical protein
VAPGASQWQTKPQESIIRVSTDSLGDPPAQLGDLAKHSRVWVNGTCTELFKKKCAIPFNRANPHIAPVGIGPHYIVYDIEMKYVLLAIIVLIASLPVQASSCDMHTSQGTSHSQHGDMLDKSDMDMDCCDQDPLDQSDNCDPMSHCGASASGVVTIDSSPVNVAFASGLRHVITDSTHTANRFDSPPFRPPIA